MKKLATLVTATATTTATVAALLMAPVAMADEHGVTIEGNLTLTTDYSFRGWSQTLRDPAIQGGFDLSTESGVYVGTWASNVNFGDTSMEWDLYIGWAGDLSEDVSVDVGFIYFDYPNDRDNFNYQELAGSVSFGAVTLGVNYSPEYLAAADVTFLYPYAGYSHGFSDDVSLDLHVGFNMADSPTGDFFGDSDEYVDYSASISFPVFGATMAIGLYGTDNEACGRDCELRPIVSLSL